MNPKTLFVVLLIAIIIYMAISQKAVCNPPYIMHGAECCMDSNQDSVCDKDQPEAFKTMPSATSTTLDPCIGLTGYNMTACVFAKEKRRYYDDCVDACNNASRDCRYTCEQKNQSKEKIACVDICFKRYTVCYAECGNVPALPEGHRPAPNSTADSTGPPGITDVF